MRFIGLYEIDIEVFTEPNQYKLNLLRLALIQPEAFWVATAKNQYLGYLSIFLLKTTKVYRELMAEAKRGTLDIIPDFLGKYGDSLVLSPSTYNLKPIHIYIDAIAIRRPKDMGLNLRQVKQLRSDLICKAKEDLAPLLNKATVCTVAVRQGVATEIKKSGVPLIDYGGRKESVTGDNLYREFFASSNIKRGVFEQILDALANVQIGRVEAFVQHDQVTQTTKGGIGIDLKK